jgi:hydrogenase nickel incorporation protein HypB
MSTGEIKIYKDIMGENDKWAENTRKLRLEYDISMINIIGSPGCGKTALLECMVRKLGDVSNFAVLEGDVETTNDAMRLHALNIEVSQLISGGACHLEAKMVHKALSDLNLEKIDMVIVENVGNLVCPAEFDIGEDSKVAVLSVTEGEDKPVKYPLLFQEAKCAVVSKIDLLKYLDYDIDECVSNIKKVNPRLPIFKLASATGEGVNEWIAWVQEQLEYAKKDSGSS